MRLCLLALERRNQVLDKVSSDQEEEEEERSSSDVTCPSELPGPAVPHVARWNEVPSEDPNEDQPLVVLFLEVRAEAQCPSYASFFALSHGTIGPDAGCASG